MPDGPVARQHVGQQHGVLVMAYGTPERTEDLEAYYTDIRRGRPPTPEQLADLRRRYDAIGGISPLAARTRAQAAGLQRALDEQDPGRFRVELGLKHAAPSVEDGARALVEAGCSETTTLVLAPHYSELSVQQYVDRAEAVFKASPEATGNTAVYSWHLEEGLIELLSERVLEAMARLPQGLRRVEVLITAHSLPARVIEMGDPYPKQLAETGEAVAKKAGLRHWRLGWQSAGRTPEPWLGPDILEVIRALPAEGVDGVVVCAAGFTSDHLEVLYDVDIEAKAVANEVGIALERTASLNDDPRFLQMLANVVRAG